MLGWKPDNPRGEEGNVGALFFFVSHQGLVFSIPLSESKLQGQPFGAPRLPFLSDAQVANSESS